MRHRPQRRRDHVYVRLLSPPSSAPRTDSAAVLPVTVDRLTAAAVAMVGVPLLIVTVAVPTIDPLDAWIAADPALPGGGVHAAARTDRPDPGRFAEGQNRLRGHRNAELVVPDGRESRRRVS